MTRIDELQKRYPTIRRDVILRNDCLVQVIRDSEDLDKVSIRLLHGVGDRVQYSVRLHESKTMIMT